MSSRTASPSVFEQLLALCRERFPRFADQWTESRRLFGPEWEQDFSTSVGAAFGSSPSPAWDGALEGYAEFCTDALRAQVAFEKSGRYRATSYAAVMVECYQSAEYMLRRYLPGLYLSHFIWPHHYRLVRAFVKSLLPVVAGEVRLFCEVGVGCGLYSQKTLQALSHARGVGYDISDYALDFTADVMRSHGLSDRYAVHNQDILTSPVSNLADLMICQEVLEHLEDPAAFVRGLYAATRSGGWGYITAAINAAHTDHIYLYRSPDEVRAQIEAAGWRVQDVQVESSYPEKKPEFRPTIAGFLVRRG
jgi:SAM-dependent methyltransferase